MTTTPTAAGASSDISKAERVYNDLRRRIRELTLPPGAPLRKDCLLYTSDAADE